MLQIPEPYFALSSDKTDLFFPLMTDAPSEAKPIKFYDIAEFLRNSRSCINSNKTSDEDAPFISTKSKILAEQHHLTESKYRIPMPKHLI